MPAIARDRSLREICLGQNIFQTKCPSKPISSAPPTPQTQNRKFPVNLGELISFLSIVEV
jgi:hypothetical protein